MTTSRALVCALVVALAGGGCGGAVDDKPPAASTAPPKKGSAPSDMCAEHGVLEAICTKCHPALATIFKAKGDWCEEHDLPESVCPLCHPERGGRPQTSVDLKDDGAPADGTMVKLKSPEHATLVGIETAKAESRPNGPQIVAVARIVFDAGRVARMNARSPGVVREVRADVGTKVKRGQALAVIESAAVGGDRSKVIAARARLDAARSTAQRKSDLHERGIAARKDVEQAVLEREAASAELAAAEAALGGVGDGGDGGSYVLTSPLDGVVVRRAVAVGQSVDQAPVLFEVVDSSMMWAEIDVPEQELAAAQPGQVVVVDVDAFPGRAFEGKVDYVSPEIEARTRTAHVRVALKNPDAALKANMFGRARIAVGTEHASVMVPRSAVQRAKDVQLVFVKKAAGHYEARRVRLGLEEGEHIEITKGIAAGEDVVTTGSFLLKTETLKDSIGAGCCD
ncbi:MAG: efflux RND transporter periplasmic adaptor subunit [Deltaproteobacteria bacterium]|nr:efflux RND transporter periplasmic adaptor subunit [Deltaproteobacteria bacterium]